MPTWVIMCCNSVPRKETIPSSSQCWDLKCVIYIDFFLFLEICFPNLFLSIIRKFLIIYKAHRRVVSRTKSNIMKSKIKWPKLSLTKGGGCVYTCNSIVLLYEILHMTNNFQFVMEKISVMISITGRWEYSVTNS